MNNKNADIYNSTCSNADSLIKPKNALCADDILRLLKQLSMQNPNNYGSYNRNSNERAGSGKPFLAALHSPSPAAIFQNLGKREEFNDDIQLVHFRNLKQKFYQHTQDSSYQGISLPEFQAIMREALQGLVSTDDVDTLFQKMDSKSSGFVSWDDVSNFLLSRTEPSNLIEAATELLDADSAKQTSSPHKDVIVLMDYIFRERKYLTVSRDGIACLWSPQLNLTRAINLVEVIGVQFWVIEAAYMHDQNKLALAVDGRMICLVDILALQPRCFAIINKLEYAPTCMCYWEQYRENESLILFGDTEGHIGIIAISRRFFLESLNESANVALYYNLRARSLLKRGSAERIGISMRITKVHDSWVVRISKSVALGSFLSCASEDQKSLVFGDIERGNIKYLSISRGVKAFALTSKPAMLIAGGRDKIIRIWNPFVLTKTAGTLMGHNSAISHLAVHTKEMIVISCAEDKVIKVWSMRTFNCLQTFADFGAHRPENYIASVYLDTLNSRFLTLSAKLNVFAFGEMKRSETRVQRDGPVVALAYNPVFKQLLSCTTTGVVSLWQIDSGALIFKFAISETTLLAAPPESGPAEGRTQDSSGNQTGSENLYGHKDVVTAMTLDSSKKQMIVALSDGEVRLYNYNLGLVQARFRLSTPAPVTGIACILMPTGEKYIVTADRGRKTHIFVDDARHKKSKIRDSFIEAFKVIEARSRHLEIDHKSDISCLVFTKSPCVCTITGSVDGSIVVRDLSSFHIMCTMGETTVPGSSSTLKSGVLQLGLLDAARTFFSCDELHVEQVLVSLHDDGQLKVWDFAVGTCLFKCNCKLSADERLSCLAIDSTRGLVYVGGSYGYLRVLNFAGLKELESVFERFWCAHSGRVNSLELINTADGRFISTAGQDNTVQLWTDLGAHVGSFCQSFQWDLSNSDTWSALPLETQVTLVSDGASQNFLWELDKLQPDQMMLVKQFIITREAELARQSSLRGLEQDESGRASLTAGEQTVTKELNLETETVEDTSNLQPWEVPTSLLQHKHATKHFSFEPEWSLNGACSSEKESAVTSATNTNASSIKSKTLSKSKYRPASAPAYPLVKGDSIYRNLECLPLQNIQPYNFLSKLNSTTLNPLATSTNSSKSKSNKN